RGAGDHRPGLLRLRRLGKHAAGLGGRGALFQRERLAAGCSLGGAAAALPGRGGPCRDARFDAAGRRAVDAHAVSRLGARSLARAGAVVTPVIFLIAEEELRHILADCEPALVIPSPPFSETVLAAAEGAGSPRVISTVAELADLARADVSAIVPRADDDLAAL